MFNDNYNNFREVACRKAGDFYVLIIHPKIRREDKSKIINQSIFWVRPNAYCRIH